MGRYVDLDLRRRTTAAYQRRPERRAVTRITERRRKLQRRGLLTLVKMASGCVDCGYRRNPAALAFDHVRGEKAFSIGHGGFSVSWAKLCAEIEKCEVRCANCHAERTWPNDVPE